MITINCAMLQSQLQECVEQSDIPVRFVKKQGMSLCFEGSDEEHQAPQIKALLKSDSRFKALYFNVEVK